MPAFNTMTEAAQYVSRRRDRRQIWCIASLEGAQYYGLLSQPNLEGYTYNHATKMLAVNNQILGRNPSHNEARARANQLGNSLNTEARNRNVVQHDRHAEEIFLEQWDDYLNNFLQLRGREPKKVDLFLSHSPCTTADNSPSPGRLLGNRMYPLSCTNKLKSFVAQNPTIKLRIHYYNKFGANEQLDENGVEQFYRGNGLVVTRMDIGVRNICQNIL